MTRNAIILAVVAPCLLSTTAQANPGPPTLSVSPMHRTDFVPLTKTNYTAAEVSPVFDEMRSKGDAYCKLRWGGGYTRKLASRFIVRPRLSFYYKKCRQCVRNVMAGCWNYFTMNDQKPQRDFELVKHLYPRAKYFDCYAIGFVQPYMMHSILGCRHLTMLDIDWRIHDGHQQLLARYAKGAISSEAALRQQLDELQIGYVAFVAKGRLRPPARQPNFHKHLCWRAGQKKLCREHLINFQRRYRELRSVELALYSVHDLKPHPERTEGTKVVFLSNAIETPYTSRKQFERMMANFKASLAVGQKMILLHHVGGFAGVLIYELRRGPSKFTLKRLCRTAYRHRRPGRWYGRWYATYFDRIATSRSAQSCWKLLAKLKREASARSER